MEALLKHECFLVVDGKIFQKNELKEPDSVKSLLLHFTYS